MRDPFSAISHYVGAVLAAVGLTFLVFSARDAASVAAFAVYGASLLALYLASGVYHTSRRNPEWLQRLDHAGIYLLIAGSYVPVCVLALPPSWGIPMLAAQGVLALAGLTANFFFGGGPKWLRLVLYLVMGWMGALAAGPLAGLLGAAGLAWLFAGGLVYTLGTVVYATRRPRLWPGRFGSHDLWHLFVLGGSACHYMVMVGLVR